MPMDQARISPMDRGFLFGDGIYEVVPSYSDRLVGFAPHMERMQNGLDAIELKYKIDQDEWRKISHELIARNEGDDLGLYFHISRGADTQRSHAYPADIKPTVYAFAFEIPPAPQADKNLAKPYKVSLTEDLRWKRCNIKSTALLGNVMHYQHGHAAGNNETILYNAEGELTEAAACNVYIVKNGVVITPLLDHQILPGITRLLILGILRKDGNIPIEERIVTVDELKQADEVWISSSSKEIAPVTEVDGQPVGDGKVGDIWLAAQTLFSAHKYDY
ncbi:UNVERIFIED_CONTAM: hypothetical protein GTU68_034905 [Idotea baltica]|nr:hypothetical protein [Idotea baltica]